MYHTTQGVPLNKPAHLKHREWNSHHINNLHTPNSSAAVPVQTPINHCSVENLTLSSKPLKSPTSFSIRLSVSLIFSSCTLLSSLILPFSRFKSSRTLLCARCISSRNRAFSREISDVSRSWSVCNGFNSPAWTAVSSERSFEKSTFSMQPSVHFAYLPVRAHPGEGERV